MRSVYNLFLLFLAMGCPLGVHAQKAVKQVGKALAAQERSFQSVISSHMDRVTLRASYAARLARSNWEAYLKSDQMIPLSHYGNA